MCNFNGQLQLTELRGHLLSCTHPGRESSWAVSQEIENKGPTASPQLMRRISDGSADSMSSEWNSRANFKNVPGLKTEQWFRREGNGGKGVCWWCQSLVSA